ncbi:MAG: hypothetical protein GY694_04545 [Gammaproteobacteria bacterium]|nr:hypothetical protein [Gammaproteobacteria bacterium]
MRDDMEFKIAGILSYFGALSFMAIWLILMLVAQPDCLETFEAAKQTAIYVLTQPDADFFYMSLFSMLVCFICGTLLFIKKYPLQVMYVVIVHAIAAIFIYDWSLVLGIALPLLAFSRVKKNA